MLLVGKNSHKFYELRQLAQKLTKQRNCLTTSTGSRCLFSPNKSELEKRLTVSPLHHCAQ